MTSFSSTRLTRDSVIDKFYKKDCLFWIVGQLQFLSWENENLCESKKGALTLHNKLPAKNTSL